MGAQVANNQNQYSQGTPSMNQVRPNSAVYNKMHGA